MDSFVLHQVFLSVKEERKPGQAVLYAYSRKPDAKHHPTSSSCPGVFLSPIPKKELSMTALWVYCYLSLLERLSQLGVWDWETVPGWWRGGKWSQAAWGQTHPPSFPAGWVGPLPYFVGWPQVSSLQNGENNSLLQHRIVLKCTWNNVCGVLKISLAKSKCSTNAGCCYSHGYHVLGLVLGWAMPLSWRQPCLTQQVGSCSQQL